MRTPSLVCFLCCLSCFGAGFSGSGFSGFGAADAQAIEPDSPGSEPVTPSPVSSAEADQIQAVIRAQLEAFQADDAVRAFGYAAPGIQAQIGSPERFLQMVQSQYAPVYRPQAVEFLELTTTAGSLVQRVRLVGPEGERVIALYSLEQQPDQSWRISGCTLVPAVRGTISA